MHITKFIDKICTKRHKKSGQTTAEAPDQWGRNRPGMAYFPESETTMMMMKVNHCHNKSLNSDLVVSHFTPSQSLWFNLSSYALPITIYTHNYTNHIMRYTLITVFNSAVVNTTQSVTVKTLHVTKCFPFPGSLYLISKYSSYFAVRHPQSTRMCCSPRKENASHTIFFVLRSFIFAGEYSNESQLEVGGRIQLTPTFTALEWYKTCMSWAVRCCHVLPCSQWKWVVWKTL
jgi:hypothetical protein